MTDSNSKPNPEDETEDHDNHECKDWVILNEDDVHVMEDYGIEIRGECEKCGRSVIAQHMLYAIYDPEEEEHIYEKTA